MMQDVVVLSNFGLMDYSLLFVVSYNPKYVNLNPEKFTNKEGLDYLGNKTVDKEYSLKDVYVDKVKDLEGNAKLDVNEV